MVEAVHQQHPSSFARENLIDAIKAAIAFFGGWLSTVSAQDLITLATVVYTSALAIEKLWKFYLWLRARKAQA